MIDLGKLRQVLAAADEQAQAVAYGEARDEGSRDEAAGACYEAEGGHVQTVARMARGLNVAMRVAFLILYR